MNPGDWERIKDLFTSAVELDPSDRPAFLRRACPDEASLVAEVESLLVAHDSDVSAPVGGRTDELGTPIDGLTRRRIDRYRIVSQIGEGGMGVVYLAVRADEEYEKRVAIKLVQTGVDARELLSRFRHERQILATLDHPHIAKLLDGGTTEEGIPYFVMEYVEGTRIDDYCDRHHLSINARVSLFLGVCSAVQYVHQNLVVHRDLKPGNILVTADGVPKLLDFGIAKLLKPELFSMVVDATRVGVMTPRYASPEQVRGEPVTTATDVYALGVVLYELLTAHRPYDLKTESAADVVRAVCEQEPDRPSAVVTRHTGDGAARSTALTAEEIARRRATVPARLARQLRGDLDAIVMQALRKEPQRRYHTIEQFAEDLRRHLERRPVTAHADSRLYRTRKLVDRHRSAVAAAALVLLSLVGGVLATSWQARIARSERARAERQFNDVRRLSTSFLFEFHDAIENLAGSTPARQLLVERALEYLRKLAEQAQGDRGLQRELAEAYLKVGDVQGNPNRANLGDLRGAAASYGEALRIARGLVAADAGNRDATRDLARAYMALGEVLPQLGNPGAAIDDLRRAAQLVESLAAANPSDNGLRQELAGAFQLLGDLQGHSGLQNVGDPAAALQSYHRAEALYHDLIAAGDRRAPVRRGLALLQIRIGDMLEFRDDLANALAAYHEGLVVSTALVAEDPNDVEGRRQLALSHRKVGGIQEDLRHYREALDEYGQAAAIDRALMNADPANVRARMSYAISLRWSGDLLATMGDTAGALRNYRAILQILESLAGAGGTDVTARSRYSEMLVQTGRLLARQGDLQEARSLTMRGLAIARELARRAEATPDDLSQYAHDFLTSEPRDLREPATALRYAQASVDTTGEIDSDNLDILAQALYANGRIAAAIETEKKAISLLTTPTTPQPLRRRRLEAQLARFESGH